MTRQGSRSRFGGFFTGFGSIGKNLKRLAVVGAFLFSGEQTVVVAEEAQYRVRIHKNFMKDILDQNFPVILDHMAMKETRHEFQIEQKDLKQTMSDFNMKFVPKTEGQVVETELFFDRGEVVMEIQDLRLEAKGQLRDSNGAREVKAEFNMDLFQLVMAVSTQQQGDNMYPMVEIKDIAFQPFKDTFKVTTGFQDIPVYQHKKIEEEIKKFVLSQVPTLEKNFQKELQRCEREIMETFAFKKDIQLNKEIGALLGTTTAHSSLSETIKMEGDNFVLDYITEFEGADLSEVSRSMRHIRSQFSDEDEHKRGVQIVIDENQLNYYFFSMLYADRPFSVTEKLLEMVPEWLEPAAFMVKAVMNAKTFSPFFPELRQYGTRRMDLKCYFDKKSLQDGQLEELQMSSLQFKDGNKVNMDLHFGCSTWLYDDHIELPQMQEFMDFVLDLYDDAEHKWKKHRSFYISMNALLDLDFSENAKEAQYFKKPFISGRVLDFNPTIHELKVFEGDTEKLSEAQSLNDAIMNMRTAAFWQNEYLKPILDLLYGQTIRLAPYPEIEGCLGLKPQQTSTTIKEGMAIVSYDYQVEPSTAQCLFQMKEGKLKQEARRLERYRNSPAGFAERKFKKFAKIADEHVFSKLPPLDLPTLMNDPNVKNVIDAVKDIDKTVNKAKDVLKKGQKVGDDMMKQAQKLGEQMGFKKPKPGIFNFMQK